MSHLGDRNDATDIARDCRSIAPSGQNHSRPFASEFRPIVAGRQVSKVPLMEVVDVLRERLKLLMAAHSTKAAPLARAADLNESAVRDILRGRSKNPGIVTLQKIASVLNLRPSALFEAGEIWPIIGEVSSGDVVINSNTDSDERKFIENPFFAQMPEGLAGLTVTDDALAPFAFQGDQLIYRASEEGVSGVETSRPCVCRHDSGRMSIRLLRSGDVAERYTLLPVNPYAAPERDARITQANPIMLVLPEGFVATQKQPTHRSSSAVHEKQEKFLRKTR